MDSFSIIIIIAILSGCIRYSYYKYKIKNKNLTNSLLYNDDTKYTLFDNDDNDDTFINTENEHLYYNQNYIDNSLNQTVSTIDTTDLFMNKSINNSIINSKLTDISFTTAQSNISNDNLKIEDNKVIKKDSLEHELFLSFSHN